MKSFFDRSNERMLVENPAQHNLLMNKRQLSEMLIKMEIFFSTLLHDFYFIVLECFCATCW